MTRKHFIEIAKILGQFTKSNDDEIVDPVDAIALISTSVFGGRRIGIVKEMIKFLIKQNPYFNISKFNHYVAEVRNNTQG